MTVGPDGALWFTSYLTTQVGRITTSGDITKYFIGQTRKTDITVGSDGELWFAEGSNIGKYNLTSGVFTDIPLPNTNSDAEWITSGSDGALWFTDLNTNKVGQITTSGVVNEYTVPTHNPGLSSITSGPDGALWFEETSANQIGRITTSGVVNEIPTGSDFAESNGVTTGPDGALWFTEVRPNLIGQLTPTPIPASPNITAPSPAQTPTLTWDAVSGATSYNIYRNGSVISSTISPTYVDSNSSSGGTETYYVTAVNSVGESPQSNSVDVQVVIQPIITSLDFTSTPMRQFFAFDVTTSADPTATLTETGALPSGITFIDNGNGVADLIGTAAAGTAGTYPLIITVSNGVGSPVTQSFTLTVTTDTSAPAITSSTTDTETFGVPFSFMVNTSGYPVPKLTKAGTLPSGVTFVDNGDGTATITGTPASSAVGTYTLAIKAKSTAGTTTQAFTLTITKAPTINKVPNKTVKVGSAFTMTITTEGSATPALTESGALPTGLTFTDNGDGTATIAGTPAAGSGKNSYPITVTATNDLGTTSQTFTLKVNEAPVITSTNTATVTIGSAFSFQVTATGFPDPTISKVGALPKGITFKGSTGTFSGTAKAGSAGSYPITVTAKNGSGTVTQGFVLTVQ